MPWRGSYGTSVGPSPRRGSPPDQPRSLLTRRPLAPRAVQLRSNGFCGATERQAVQGSWLLCVEDLPARRRTSKEGPRERRAGTGRRSGLHPCSKAFARAPEYLARLISRISKGGCRTSRNETGRKLRARRRGVRYAALGGSAAPKAVLPRSWTRRARRSLVDPPTPIGGRRYVRGEPGARRRNPKTPTVSTAIGATGAKGPRNRGFPRGRSADDTYDKWSMLGACGRIGRFTLDNQGQHRTHDPPANTLFPAGAGDAIEVSRGSSYNAQACLGRAP